MWFCQRFLKSEKNYTVNGNCTVLAMPRLKRVTQIYRDKIKKID